MANEKQYSRIIAFIFQAHYRPGLTELEFEREEIVRAATSLGLERPKNVGDVVYSFRFRQPFPKEIRSTAPANKEWVLRKVGNSRYRFVLAVQWTLSPNTALSVIKVPDATPGVISRYALGDEQALLSKLRYNRLVDLFTGLTCYSLQNHLRTSVADIGQVETDELYVGLDRRGCHYILPIQAKGGRDRLGAVQIEQDIALCAEKFPALVCRPLAAQFMADEVIALFEFEDTEAGVRVREERHYQLVPQEQLTVEELSRYRQASDAGVA
ncbi:MAG: endonuclease [Verrucomicrobia bacterium]|nr:endonuclease [Verrucomicrobiota bacterium]